jgi:hypothetical protein
MFKGKPSTKWVTCNLKSLQICIRHPLFSGWASVGCVHFWVYYRRLCKEALCGMVSAKILVTMFILKVLRTIEASPMGDFCTSSISQDGAMLATGTLSGMIQVRYFIIVWPI